MCVWMANLSAELMGSDGAGQKENQENMLDGVHPGQRRKV